MIRFVEKEDIGQVLSMMEEVKEDFAGYKEEEFLDALEKAIRNREAFLEEEEGKLAGMISFSYEEKGTYLSGSTAGVSEVWNWKKIS